MLALQGEERRELLVPHQLPFSALCSATACWGHTLHESPSSPEDTVSMGPIFCTSQLFIPQARVSPCHRHM